MNNSKGPITRLLKFRTDEIKKLAEHSIKAAKRRPTFAQQEENTTIPKGFILVKDQGVYLLSNGLNAQDQTPNESGLVVFAESCNPNTDEDWYHNAWNICGGDDFAEFIELDWFLYAQSEHCDYVIIEMTDTTMILRDDLMRERNV